MWWRVTILSIRCFPSVSWRREKPRNNQFWGKSGLFSEVNGHCYYIFYCFMYIMINKDLFHKIIQCTSIYDSLPYMQYYVLIGTNIQLIITSRGFNSLLMNLFKKKYAVRHFDFGSFLYINNKDDMLLLDSGFSSLLI